MKLISKVIATAALAVSAMSATSANAATLLVNYTPTTDVSKPFSFNVDSNPTPLATSTGAFLTSITNATGQYLGRTSVDFFSLSSGGLFGLYYGAQAYSGTTAAPTILTGTYNALHNNNIAQAGIVTISAMDGAVPEPATWAMMLAGVGAMGFAMRRSNRKFDAKIKRMASAVA